MIASYIGSVIVLDWECGCFAHLRPRKNAAFGICQHHYRTGATLAWIDGFDMLCQLNWERPES